MVLENGVDHRTVSGNSFLCGAVGLEYHHHCGYADCNCDCELRFGNGAARAQRSGHLTQKIDAENENRWSQWQQVTGIESGGDHQVESQQANDECHQAGARVIDWPTEKCAPDRFENSA